MAEIVTPEAADLSTVAIHLFKGPVYSAAHPKVWSRLITLRSRASDYVAVLGLTLVVDESEGYAYLRGQSGDEEVQLPRLVARHSLSFRVSILLALLRRRLAEQDTADQSTRLVLTTDDIVALFTPMLPVTTDETRTRRDVVKTINQVIDLGYLKRLKGTSDTYEVQRIIKAFIDGEWLHTLDQRISTYRAELRGELADPDPTDHNTTDHDTTDHDDTGPPVAGPDLIGGGT